MAEEIKQPKITGRRRGDDTEWGVSLPLFAFVFCCCVMVIFYLVYEVGYYKGVQDGVNLSCQHAGDIVCVSSTSDLT